MPARLLNRKSGQTKFSNQQQSELPLDNVTEFPGKARKTAQPTKNHETGIAEPARLYGEAEADEVRTIDAIADHVLAARYLSAEEEDGELNRLLDLVLLRIGRTLAVLDGPRPHGLKTH